MSSSDYLEPSVVHSASPALQEKLWERWFPRKWPFFKSARENAQSLAIRRFVFEAVRTRDLLDMDDPVKPLPRITYLERHLDDMVRQKRLAVLKSRRTIVTLTTYSGICWFCESHPHQAWALVPQTGEDGSRHIRRYVQDGIFAYQPEWVKARFELRPVTGTFEIAARDGQAWGSIFLSYAKGDDKLRSETHSGIYWDEFAFQDNAEEMWGAVVPTMSHRDLEKRGRLILVSTANSGSYMGELLGPDKKEAAQLGKLTGFAAAKGTFRPINEGPIRVYVPGVAEWTSGNLSCRFVHHTADPLKATEEWIRSEAGDYVGGVTSSKWKREMDGDFEAADGVRVVWAFDRGRNVIDPGRFDLTGWRVKLSADWGQTAHTAVIFWAQDPASMKMIIFDTIYVSNTKERGSGLIESLKAEIYARLARHYQIPVRDLIERGLDGLVEDAVGDPQGRVYMDNLATDPLPVAFHGNIPGILRVNARKTQVGEEKLNRALWPQFICCGRRQMSPDGRALVQCSQCNEERRAEPWLYMLRGVAEMGEDQLEHIVRRKKKPGQTEAPERNEDQEDHWFDAAIYGIMIHEFESAKDDLMDRVKQKLEKPTSRAEQIERALADMAKRAALEKTMLDEQGEVAAMLAHNRAELADWLGDEDPYGGIRLVQ